MFSSFFYSLNFSSFGMSLHIFNQMFIRKNLKLLSDVAETSSVTF